MNQIGSIFKDKPLKIAVLKGPQGFGKTQIAKRYVYNNFAAYDLVWWFKAGQYLKPQFEKFALAIGSCLGQDVAMSNVSEERLIDLVKDTIRRQNFKVLLVFDDVNAYEDIKNYILFSHNNCIHTIITTKNGGFSLQPITVKAFSRDNSLKYISLYSSRRTASG